MKKMMLALLLGVCCGAPLWAQTLPNHVMIKSESRFNQRLMVEMDLGDFEAHPELKDLEKNWERSLQRLRSHVAMIEFFEDMGYTLRYYNIVESRVDNRRATMDHTHYFWFSYPGEPPTISPEEEETPDPEG